MKKALYTILSVAGIFAATQAAAQLSANPWDTAEFDKAVKATATTSTMQEAAGADVGHVSANTEKRAYIPSIKYSPKNADAKAPVYKPAIGSNGTSKTGIVIQGTGMQTQTASEAEDTTGTVTGNWRGSGKYGGLNYTGSVTTYGTAYGQEMLAPEVNTHNMNMMVQHLRNLGYKIPEKYNNGFQNLTKNYAKDLRKAYDGLGHQHNPFDTMFSGFLDVVEDQSGLDMENLLFNSVDLISRD